jgi:hypothetical protein
MHHHKYIPSAVPDTISGLVAMNFITPITRSKVTLS